MKHVLIKNVTIHVPVLVDKVVSRSNETKPFFANNFDVYVCVFCSDNLSYQIIILELNAKCYIGWRANHDK